MSRSKKDKTWRSLIIFLAFVVVVFLVERYKSVGYDEGYDEGYDAAYSEGYDKGYYEGYDLGRSDGYDSGYYDGKSEGYSKGYDEGYYSGYDEGLLDGHGVGYDEGYDDGYSNNVSSGLVLPTSQIVYVSRAGKIHSNPSCSGMKYYTEMVMSTAMARGYVKCEKCY